MTDISELKKLYDEYKDAVWKEQESRTFTDGLNSIIQSKKDMALEDSFTEKITDLAEVMTQEVAESGDSGRAKEILSFVYAGQSGCRDMSTEYFMFSSVHGLFEDMIDCLSREDAAELAAKYAEDIPARKRFPVNKKVLKHLKRRAAGK